MTKKAATETCVETMNLYFRRRPECRFQSLIRSMEDICLPGSTSGGVSSIWQTENLWNTQRKNTTCEIHTQKYTIHKRMKPPVIARDKICAIHTVNTQCKYTMQLHKWLESPILARQKICEKYAFGLWPPGFWTLHLCAFAQSVVFWREKVSGGAVW